MVIIVAYGVSWIPFCKHAVASVKHFAGYSFIHGCSWQGLKFGDRRKETNRNSLLPRSYKRIWQIWHDEKNCLWDSYYNNLCAGEQDVCLISFCVTLYCFGSTLDMLGNHYENVMGVWPGIIAVVTFNVKVSQVLIQTGDLHKKKTSISFT